MRKIYVVKFYFEKRNGITQLKNTFKKNKSDLRACQQYVISQPFQGIFWRKFGHERNQCLMKSDKIYKVFKGLCMI